MTVSLPNFPTDADALWTFLRDLENRTTAVEGVSLALNGTSGLVTSVDPGNGTPEDGAVVLTLGKLGAAAASHNHVAADVTDLGTAAVLNVGTGANEIVQLDSSARLPSLDASQLLNLPAQTITPDPVVSVGADRTLAQSDGGTFFKLTSASLQTITVDANSLVTNACVTLAKTGSGTFTVAAGAGSPSLVDMMGGLTGLAQNVIVQIKKSDVAGEYLVYRIQ